MEMFLFWCAIGFVSGTVFASLFEWTLHRYFMHRSIMAKFFRYPFERHTLVHHHVFKYDHTYHLIHEPDKKTIPMAWWNGPVIVAIGLLPFLIWSFFSHKWGVMCGAAIACTLYFTAYEYMHWCMHLPKKRHVERSGIFFRLNGHHLLHHRYMGKNFNVVLPLADLCLGTLLLRSKVAFAQPRGPSVPDVQPKVTKHSGLATATR
ncbi:MAG TPA: hypothetical protein VK811_10795 [Candidatus Acidoferrum sp.]|jgi:hypothetical protein|nr:hypothetical protein [Candidatus Acidoferrum sp.]